MKHPYIYAIYLKTQKKNITNLIKKNPKQLGEIKLLFAESDDADATAENDVWVLFLSLFFV